MTLLHIDDVPGLATSHALPSTAKHSWRSLVPHIAKLHGVRERDIFSACTERASTNARQHLMYVLRERGWSYPRIGAALGRDHTTCLHGVRKHIERNAMPAAR